MPLTCPKCSRLSPDDALYCHRDGQALRAFQAPAAPNRLGRPFVFPSGRTCQTFDELVESCQVHWDEARSFLQTGVLANYLGGMGRSDLSQAAREAAKNPDPDRGLEEFLERLPADSTPGAKLVATPTQLDLGTLRPGVDQSFEIRIKNAGRGLMHGSVSCDDCYFLQVGNTPGQKQKLFQTRDEIVIPVHVRGKVLRAGNKVIEGQLVVNSNGGSANIAIRAAVPVTPFQGGPLNGVKSPRQLAEKAKAHSKEVIPFFENGSVVAWYKSNGWTWPIQGPSAQGLGAIQQFFEALGLTPPPKVEISHKAIALHGQAGEQVSQLIHVSAQEKRPVYAHASGDQSWLSIGRVKMSGRTAEIPVVVSIPDQPGDNLVGNLIVTSNGNQKFKVPVRLSISGSPRVGGAPIPVSAAVASVPTLPYAPTGGNGERPRAASSPNVALASAPIPYSIPPVASAVSTAPAAVAAPMTLPIADGDAPDATRDQLPRWLPWIPVGFLVVALCVTGVRDLVVKPPVESAGVDEGLGNWEEPERTPKELLGVSFHAEDAQMSLGVGGQKSDVTGETGRLPVSFPSTMSFGMEARGDDGAKRLTFTAKGMTQNTCVRIDRRERLFGHEPLIIRAGPDKDKPLSEGIFGERFGRWRERETSLGTTKSGRSRPGFKSTWVFDTAPIVVTQHVEVIVGNSGDLDTCLIQFTIKNEDTVEHEVGLRYLLDTFIGVNDGVPFLIPGQSNLINTRFGFGKIGNVNDFRQADLRGEWASEIPDFLQAREREDLSNPGTVAQLGFKLQGLEPPDAVTLGAYPNPDLRTLDPRCNQEKTMWQVPMLSIQTAKPPDSAVTIYWNEKPLKKGEVREVGFTYGLGKVASDKGGKLGLTSGGEFFPDGKLTVTAYVGNPQPGQTVTLNLPRGFEFIDDDATKKVPASGSASRTSPITWKVRASGKKGEFTFTAETSNGLSQTHTITIRGKRIFGG